MRRPHGGATRLYFAVAPLYVAFGLCLGLLQVALPTVLQREGLPIEYAGYLALLFLPVGLSALWASLVDRIRPFGLERRFGWVIASQTLVVFSLVVIALAGPQRLAWLVPALALLAFAAATMDVTMDGHVSETSTPDGRATRGGLKISCIYLGTIMGSLLVLNFFETLGWQSVLMVAAVFCTGSLVPFVLFFRSSKTGTVRRPALRAFFAQRGMTSRSVWLAILGASLGVALAAVRLLLVARGLPLSDIGLFFGPVSMAAGLAGAVLGALAGRRWGSGAALMGAACLFGFGASAIAVATAVILSSTAATGLTVAVCTIAYGTIYASVSALAMGWVEPGQAATDYAIVQSIWNCSILLGGGFSGLALGQTGTPLFGICGAFVVVACLLVRRSRAPNSAMQPT